MTYRQGQKKKEIATSACNNAYLYFKKINVL